MQVRKFKGKLRKGLKLADNWEGWSCKCGTMNTTDIEQGLCRWSSLSSKIRARNSKGNKRLGRSNKIKEEKRKNEVYSNRRRQWGNDLFVKGNEE